MKVNDLIIEMNGAWTSAFDSAEMRETEDFIKVICYDNKSKVYRRYQYNKKNIVMISFNSDSDNQEISDKPF